MFHIKICGIRRLSEVEDSHRLGADAIGLNFFPPSVRYVEPDSNETKKLSEAAAASGLIRVGVFVNEDASKIADTAHRVGLDVIQLHGDETIEQLSELRDHCELPVIRAIKLPTGEIEPDQISILATPWMERGVQLLLDADAGKSHGGSGKILDWASIRRWSQQNPDACWTLAGGLNPENVARAIELSGATSVDTASGVESCPGEKSRSKIGRFVEQCRTQWNQR